MNVRAPRQVRSGITLTEILISILIMAVGMVSLASLFPVGMDRIRKGQRNARSALLMGSVQSDIGTRNLFSPESFLATPFYGFATPYAYDPWVQDWPLPGGAVYPMGGANVGLLVPNGVYRGWGLTGKEPSAIVAGTAEPLIPGTGLPVCYDPLWWAAINGNDATATPASARAATGSDPTRFGRGPTLRGTPNTPDGDNGTPSAFGLQRITNAFWLDPSTSRIWLDRYVGTVVPNIPSTFASQDDPVLMEEGERAGQGSPVLPALDTSGNMVYDWSFSWLFTGRRADVSNKQVYEGDVVVFHNRPFALDPDTSGNTTAAGERVVEAVFGYGGSVRIGVNDAVTGLPTVLATGTATPPTVGYAANSRSVLLRWPIGEPDPEVKVGSWIADVTYEQYHARQARFNTLITTQITPLGFTPTEFYPAQRCHWYRVVRKTDAEPETATMGPPLSSGLYRRMVLTVETPVQSKTLLWGTAPSRVQGDPVFVNAALVSPYVINVFPKVFYSR
jgi:type II secretory pathway pseudopilin PulG